MNRKFEVDNVWIVFSKNTNDLFFYLSDCWFTLYSRTCHWYDGKPALWWGGTQAMLGGSPWPSAGSCHIFTHKLEWKPDESGLKFTQTISVRCSRNNFACPSVLRDQATDSLGKSLQYINVKSVIVEMVVCQIMLNSNYIRIYMYTSHVEFFHVLSARYKWKANTNSSMICQHKRFDIQRNPTINGLEEIGT